VRESRFLALALGNNNGSASDKPAAAKAASEKDPYGTAEAVPLHKTLGLKHQYGEWA